MILVQRGTLPIGTCQIQHPIDFPGENNGMIRLAIQGADVRTCREISIRLRHGSIASCDSAATESTLANACDAVAFVGTSSIDSDEVLRYLVAGKHVLVTTEADHLRTQLDKWVHAANQSGARLAVVNPDHSLPSRQLIWQQISSGKLGDVGLMRIHRWDPAITGQAIIRSQLPVPLINDLELATWMFGRLPATVYAIEQLPSESPNTFESPMGRLVQVHLGFPGGGMALINYSNRLPSGDGYQSLSVIGSSGAAYADDHQNRQLVFSGGPPQAVRSHEGTVLTRVLQEFIDDLRELRDFSTSRSIWPAVWNVGDAILQSLESRQAIHRESWRE